MNSWAEITVLTFWLQHYSLNALACSIFFCKWRR